ncbi:MAG: SGNH/GDSL hydrolase family protein, partial [Neisseriaceae bacterium]|nr:SGNH/GDSL hydrolase family protein [Neisseriaceae bacterium]
YGNGVDVSYEYGNGVDVSYEYGNGVDVTYEYGDGVDVSYEYDHDTDYGANDEYDYDTDGEDFESKNVVTLADPLPGTGSFDLGSVTPGDPVSSVLTSLGRRAASSFATNLLRSALSSFGPSLSSGLPLLASSALPLVSVGLPSSSSIGPSLSLAVPSMGLSYAPIISGMGSVLSWRMSSNPSRSDWKYGFHEYNYDANYDDFEFKNLVTFGDSLSDTGSFGRGSVYMGDGNPYVLYNSYLSLALSGKVVTPERFGGANYAMSGSVLRNDPLDPMSWIIHRDSLKAQIDRYLERNGGVANKDDAFIVWGGGNDVTADIQYALINPLNWGTVFNGAQPNQPY